jgi:integrase
MGLVMCISLRKSFIYPGVGIARWHHVGPLVRQRVVKEVIRKAGITEAVSAHTFWHSFATHQREAGDDTCTVQARPDHRDVSPTLIYKHVLNRGGRGVQSPADLLSQCLMPALDEQDKCSEIADG